MRISGTHYRTIWPTDTGSVRVIDQSRLPFEFATVDLYSLEDAAAAIRTMVVRGAPLIGATAAYGLALAMRSNPSDAHIDHAAQTLEATRPTAHNLAWALTKCAGHSPRRLRRTARTRRFGRPRSSAMRTLNSAGRSALTDWNSSVGPPRRFGGP